MPEQFVCIEMVLILESNDTKQQFTGWFSLAWKLEKAEKAIQWKDRTWKGWSGTFRIRLWQKVKIELGHVKVMKVKIGLRARANLHDRRITIQPLRHAAIIHSWKFWKLFNFEIFRNYLLQIWKFLRWGSPFTIQSQACCYCHFQHYTHHSGLFWSWTFELS